MWGAKMKITQKDLDLLNKQLKLWQGGKVSFNSFNDDHDRLILRLESPSREMEPVGLSLFYCTYIAGPIQWSGSELNASLSVPDDGSVGIEINDMRAGFIARCASISLYGEPVLTVPQS